MNVHVAAAPPERIRRMFSVGKWRIGIAFTVAIVVIAIATVVVQAQMR
jgi:hypothetical protein